MDGIAHHPHPLSQEPRAQQPDRDMIPTLTDDFIDSLSDAEAKSWLCCLHSSIRKTTRIDERRNALKFWRDFSRRGEGERNTICSIEIGAHSSQTHLVTNVGR